MDHLKQMNLFSKFKKDKRMIKVISMENLDILRKAFLKYNAWLWKTNKGKRNQCYCMLRIKFS